MEHVDIIYIGSTTNHRRFFKSQLKDFNPHRQENVSNQACPKHKLQGLDPDHQSRSPMYPIWIVKTRIYKDETLDRGYRKIWLIEQWVRNSDRRCNGSGFTKQEYNKN